MTLAAAYMIGRIPAVLSDVLVSGGSHPDHSPIATRVDLTEPLPLDWEVRVNGLSRKSIKVGANAAVAGAGNGLGLAVICRKLEACFRDRMVTAGALAAELAEMDDAMSASTACTLVGWIVEQDGARSFRWESTNPSEVEWDGDHITGTGSDLFRAIAWSDNQRSWDVVDTFDHAQHYALAQISSLLVNEISNGAPIQNLFGGGYDLLIWDGTCFRQAADVSFLFLSLEWLRSPTKRMGDPAPILIRQAELEDCLIVRVMLPNNQLQTTSSKHERIAVISPITVLGRMHRFQQPHEPSEVPYFAERIFVNITGIGRSGSLQHWTGGVRGAEATLFRLEAHPESGRIRFFLPTDIMDNMSQVAERHFGLIG